MRCTDENSSFDIQEYLFGNPSRRELADLEQEEPDNEPPSSSSPRSSENALNITIEEIRTIGSASKFLEEPTNSDSDGEIEVDIPEWQNNFTCMQAHDGTESLDNPNSKTIEILGKMQAHYERISDTWRAISYRKAISILKKTKTFIYSEKQAIKYESSLKTSKLIEQNTWDWG